MIYQQKFTLARVGEILEMNPGTLRTHIQRGLVVGQGPRNTSGRDKPAGKHARFGFHTLMEFAIAYTLVNEGLPLETSFKAAADFAHASGGGIDGPMRDPGLPFHSTLGQTIFAVARRPNGNTRTCEELWNPGGEGDTYGKISHHLNCDNFTCINASKVFDRVCMQIGVHPDDALNAAYPEDAS